MNIRTNVKKQWYDIPVKSDDGTIFYLHIEAESEAAAKMLIPKTYKIVSKEEVV